MERATGLLAYYHAVSSGRWAPQAEVHVVSGTALDGGAAVHLASEAAKGAVAAAMKPLIAGMTTELEQATEERDRRVEEERPHGLVGWLRA